MENQMTVGKWLIVFILSSIPCVNIIMLLIWAFGDDSYPSRKTYARAMLIYVAICFVLVMLLYLIMGASVLAFMSAFA